MSGYDYRALLEAAALDLLEGDEATGLEQHLTTCSPCRAEERALGEVYAELTQAVDEDDAAIELSASLKDQILAALAEEPAADTQLEKADDAKPDGKNKGFVPPATPTKDAEALGIKVKLSCSYCHAPTGRAEVTFCAACLAPHHRECFRAHGRCSTLGCEETRTVRPIEPDLGPPPRQPRWRRRFLFGLAIAGVTGGAIAAMGPDRFDDLAAQLGFVPPTAAFSEAFQKQRRELLEELRTAVDGKNRLRAGSAMAQIQGLCNEELKAGNSDAAYQLLGEAELILRELGSTNARFSIAFYADPLAKVAEVIGTQAGRTIQVDDDVEADVVTLQLKKVTWWEALEAIAETADCRIEERAGGVLALSQPPQVTLKFVDANVRTVIQMIAERTGKNIIISPDVRGSVTLDLKECFWDEALLSVVHTVGDYEVVATGETLSVVSRSALEEVENPGVFTVPHFAPPAALPAQEFVSAPAEPQVDRFDMSLTDTRLDEVAKRIAEHADRSIVIDPGVDRKPLNVELRNVTWTEALETVATLTRCRVEERPGRVLLLTQPPRVTVQFTDANVRTVIQLIAAYSGKNVIVSPYVRGTVTLDLKEIYWDEALLALLQTVGDYVAVTEGDTVRITDSSTLLSEEPEPARLSIARWEPVHAPFPEPGGVALKDIDVTDADLRDVVATLADGAFRTIAVDPLIQERVSISVKNMPWHQALRLVALQARCRIEPRGSVLLLRQPPKITIQFTDASARTVLQLLAAYSGKNIVISPTLRGQLTVELKAADWIAALRTIAETLEHEAWVIGEDAIMIRPQGAPHPDGAKRLELGGYWELLPGDETQVSLSKGTLAQLCEQFVNQTGCPIYIRTTATETPYELGVRDRPWREALGILARRCGVTIAEETGGLIVRSPEPNTLQTYDANVRTWLKVMTTLAGRNAVISPRVMGTISMSLKDVPSYGDALEATVRSQGLMTSQLSDVTRIDASMSGRGVAQGDQRPVRPFLLGGKELRLSLQAIAITPKRRFVVLGDRIYRQGDTLIDEATSEELEGFVVKEIRGATVGIGIVLITTNRGDSIELSVMEQEPGIYVTTAKRDFNVCQDVETLIGLLNDKEWDSRDGDGARTRLVQLTDELDPELLIKPLEEAATELEHGRRGSAIHVLGQILWKTKARPDRSIKILQLSARDADPLVQKEARSALILIRHPVDSGE